MELKVYFEGIEIELPLYQEEKDLDFMLEDLKGQFGSLVDNVKVLNFFDLKLGNGK